MKIIEFIGMMFTFGISGIFVLIISGLFFSMFIGGLKDGDGLAIGFLIAMWIITPICLFIKRCREEDKESKIGIDEEK